MSTTKRVSSETDSPTKRKARNPSSDDRENVDTTSTSGGLEGILQPKVENPIQRELEREKGATPIGDVDMYYPVYPMNGSRQGIIIVNQNFIDEKHFREGAENDQDNLEKIYKHLEVEYTVFNDLKENEMFDQIKEFSKSIKFPCSAVFVSISTHGQDNGGLMGFEGRFVNISEIIKCFETEELLGIPKIFIIQACKGDAKEKRECDGDSSHTNSTIQTQYCTKRADVLIAYSTSEGCVSYRNEKDGSWFIEVLRNCILDPKYDERHFVEILTICTYRIVNDYTENDLTQTPSYCSTLRKFLKFKNRGKPQKYVNTYLLFFIILVLIFAYLLAMFYK